MNYLRRQTVCDKLRIAPRQSYRIVGSSYGDRISSDDVLFVINKSRRGIENPLSFIPSDLMTPEETTSHFSSSELTMRELFAWIHRTKNVPPHFRFNKRTIRFSANLLYDWLENRSRIRRFV